MPESTNSGELSNKGEASFTLFSKLPPELQLKVWSFAIPGPRVVVLHRKRHAAQTIPGMLSTNYDSRKEVLKHYEPRLSSCLKPGHPTVYFNPKDVVLFNNLRILRRFLSQVTRADGEQIHNLALVPFSFSTPGNGKLLRNNAKEFSDCLMWSLWVVIRAVETLGRVEEITFISPIFPTEEDNELVTKTLGKFSNDLKYLIDKYPDPADWWYNLVPKLPAISVVRCNFDFEVANALVKGT